MGPMRALPLLGAGLLSIAAAAPATAAPVQANPAATGRVGIVLGTEARKLQDLNFATLSVAGAGTAIIDPNTDAMSTTGGVLHVAGTPYAAEFEGVSPRKGVVIVRIPNKPITLTRSGGTETMTVSSWTISGGKNRNVAAHEPFAFKVGGTLAVAANQAEGLYNGTFDVEIQYP